MSFTHIKWRRVECFLLAEFYPRISCWFRNWKPMKIYLILSFHTFQRTRTIFDGTSEWPCHIDSSIIILCRPLNYLFWVKFLKNTLSKYTKIMTKIIICEIILIWQFVPIWEFIKLQNGAWYLAGNIQIKFFIFEIILENIFLNKNFCYFFINFFKINITENFNYLKSFLW